MNQRRRMPGQRSQDPRSLLLDGIGPFDIAGAVPLTDDSRYAGRIVRDRAGDWQFLAFRNLEDGVFVGMLADPVPFAALLAEARGAPVGVARSGG